jgi:large subunit ribosomal protein L5
MAEENNVASESKVSVTKENSTKSNENIMRSITISKLTLNIGSGKSEDMLKKGLKLLAKISPVKPMKTTTQKRIPGWSLRPGLAIGAKATIRKNTTQILKRLLAARSNILSLKNFDTQGNFSFGIPEYIDIPGLEYDPDLKIMGLEVAVTLERPGFKIKKRKINPKKVGKSHLITKEDAQEFVTKEFGVTFE